MRKGAVVGQATGVVVALLLSGCSGGGAPGDDPLAADGAGTLVAGLALPTWAVGDWWSYTLTSGQESAPTTYVVNGASASDWTMATDSAERAFQDLRDDISRLGPQRKSDLAGSQGSDRVEFFHWPLQAGANWTTRWDHQDVAVRVVSVDLAKNTADLMAHNATQMVYEYTYDAGLGWFQKLAHYGAGGEVLVSFDIDKHGHNWTGEVASWDLDVILDVDGMLGQGTQSAMYEVPLTATDVWVHAVLHCTSGAAQAGTSPAPFAGGLTGTDDRGGGASGQPCPSDEEFSGSAGAPEAPPQGGTSETWGYAIAGAPNAGTYELEILVRTLTMTPFGG